MLGQPCSEEAAWVIEHAPDLASQVTCGGTSLLEAIYQTQARIRRKDWEISTMANLPPLLKHAVSDDEITLEQAAAMLKLPGPPAPYTETPTNAHIEARIEARSQPKPKRRAMRAKK